MEMGKERQCLQMVIVCHEFKFIGSLDGILSTHFMSLTHVILNRYSHLVRIRTCFVTLSIASFLTCVLIDN